MGQFCENFEISQQEKMFKLGLSLPVKKSLNKGGKHTVNIKKIETKAEKHIKLP